MKGKRVERVLTVLMMPGASEAAELPPACRCSQTGTYLNVCCLCLWFWQAPSQITSTETFCQSARLQSSSHTQSVPEFQTVLLFRARCFPQQETQSSNVGLLQVVTSIHRWRQPSYLASSSKQQ